MGAGRHGPVGAAGPALAAGIAGQEGARKGDSDVSRAGRLRGLAMLAGLAGLGALADASAEGDGNWLKWHGPADASANDDPTDREFIKEWEATPPKGYPTLSPNNLIPIKAAIIRYSQIMARGGWKLLPDLQLQQGSTGPAVAILQEHLLMTGDLKEQGGNPESFDYFLDQGGTPLSSLERACSHRHRRQAHHCGAEPAGRSAPQAAQDQSCAP